MKRNLSSILKGGAATVALAMFLFARSPLGRPILAGPGKSARPNWEIDLSKFGYQGRPPVPQGNADQWGFWTRQQGVVFTEPNVLAVFFVVHDDPSGAASPDRKALASDPYRLVALFLKAETGELIKKLDWPLPIATRSVSRSFFFPTTNGRFIVGLGDTLSLYSPKFEVLARYDAPQGSEVVASPAGDTILLYTTQRVGGEWKSKFDLLDTDRLSVRKSWEDHPQQNQLLWGEELFWASRGSLNFTTVGAEPKRSIESSKESFGYGFINKETIAVIEGGASPKLSLLSTDGTMIQEFDLGLEGTDGPPAISRNGLRFAVPSYEWGSGANLNPKKLLARVFDLGSEKPVLTIDVPRHYGTSSNFHTPLGDTRFGWGGLALSPDGELLAVKSGPSVQLYQLPKQGTTKACAANCNNENDAANSQDLPSQTLPSSAKPTPSASPEVIQQALSWLPADTETVTVANGPFLLPDIKREGEGTEPSEKADQDLVRETFEGLTSALFGFKDGLFEKNFKEQKMVLGMEGSRNFGVPSGLGEGPFQGGAILVFADDITGRANSFMRDVSKAALRMDQVEGHEVAVFQEKLEEDTWTTFVAFPKPNIAVAASNEEYLKEMLARLNGKSGKRALPNTLPEWKHVNIRAEFWAVRHFNKKGGTTDPTSPFTGGRGWSLSDDDAIGLTFSFDPAQSKTATIAYLTGNKEILQNVQKNLFPIETEPGARELHIRYRQVEAGVVEGSYDLEHIESAELFDLVLASLLGHAVAI